VLTKLLLLTVALGFAHEAGHGPVVEGKGPGGGKLAAVIAASEAEKGADASLKAVAEWKLAGGKLEVKLWDNARKQALPASGDVKWILLGKKLAKPVVFTEKGLESENAALKNADSVELILPALGSSREKHVVAISLK